MLSLNYSSANLRLFCSAPLAHCAVAGCLLNSVCHSNSMSHLGHHGWVVFPSSKMTTVSSTCRCMKCTRIAVLVAARPGNPSTGQLRGPPMDGSTCSTSAAVPLRPSFSRSIFPLPLAHSVTSCALPMILPPSLPLNPCTAPVPSVAPGRWVPLPSSIACKPPQNGSLPPVICGRPCQLSSRH